MNSSSLAYVVCIFCVMVFVSANAQKNVFNVLNYGAIGNDIVNDTSALTKAWNDACYSKASKVTVVIPQESQFSVDQTTFTGPCKPTTIYFQLSGTLLAPDGPSQWKAADKSRWITFKDVNGVIIDGHGTMEGRGNGWWDQSCRYHPTLKGCTKLAPTILKFDNCHNIRMSNINLYNSPQTHISVIGSYDMDLGFLKIQSPGSAPNTDGIHLHICSNISIHNSQIAAGDDCISIGDHIYEINITDIKCGPGHGVSIGSLGKDGGISIVRNVNVKRVNFQDTTNGVRIKTWQTGRGYILNVSFSNINFTNVENPIIIDQFYCDARNSCPQTKTGISINGVVYSQLYGTSKTEAAISLNCSSNFPCKNITLSDIQLASATPGKKLYSTCSNAFGYSRGIVEPKSCLR